MKFFEDQRREVMHHIEGYMLKQASDFLIPIENIWQPADLLPDASKDSFFEEVQSLQEHAKSLPYDLLAVLIGDTITEEALPTYESWLSMVEGVSKDANRGWMTWIRRWTAEENRHGDLLNKYLYLTGRINMRMMEISTQYLLSDGFDIQTGADPYRNFIYTSFQERATNLAHRRVAAMAKATGNTLLSRICGTIASDEIRHAKAYQFFLSKIFEVDASEAMIAFKDMMKKKIVMPAHFLREMGVSIGKTFTHFTDAAERLGIYTTTDYIDILKSLIKEWHIESMRNLNEAGEKARDYISTLPDRLSEIAKRMRAPKLEYKFSWIQS